MAGLLALTAMLVAGPGLAPAAQRGEGGQAQAGSAGKITEISVSRASGVVSAWLENGVRVHHRRMAVAPEDRGGGVGGEQRVLITVAVAGGELLESEATRGLSAAAAAAWRRPATRSTDAAAMAAHLRERRIKVGGYASGDAMILRVDAPAADVAGAMKIAAALLTEPVIDAAYLETWTKETASKLDAPTEDVRWLLMGAVREVSLPRSEARFRPLAASDLASIDAARAQAWLDRHLRDAPTPVEVSIVGELSAGEAMAGAESALAALPRRERVSAATFAAERSTRRPRGPLAARIPRPLPRGTALAGAGFFGTDGVDLSTQRALSVAAQVVDERVTIRVRERGWGGLSDVVTLTYPGGMSPGESGLVFPSVRVAPSLAGPAADLVERTIAELVAGGPTPDELRRAQRAVSREAGRILASPNYWAGVLAQATYRGCTPDDLAAAVEFVGGLRAEDVVAALRAHATTERAIRVIVEPSGGR